MQLCHGSGVPDPTRLGVPWPLQESTDWCIPQLLKQVQNSSDLHQNYKPSKHSKHWFYLLALATNSRIHCWVCPESPEYWSVASPELWRNRSHWSIVGTTSQHCGTQGAAIHVLSQNQNANRRMPTNFVEIARYKVQLPYCVSRVVLDLPSIDANWVVIALSKPCSVKADFPAWRLLQFGEIWQSAEVSRSQQKSEVWRWWR